MGDEKTRNMEIERREMWEGESTQCEKNWGRVRNRNIQKIMVGKYGGHMFQMFLDNLNFYVIFFLFHKMINQKK